ncbi:MAG: hemerythrin domain-containing protein [Planctomycetes bacterium]|jgi:hemerythrin|nr:hemerythrin domain-containing protein [Planctomycetota bacterium]
MDHRYPPLKRHVSLQPFSRDHFLGLTRARQLSQAAAAGASARIQAKKDMLAAWKAEIEAHFDEEERLLIPLMTPAWSARLGREHRAIRALVAAAQPDGPDMGATWCGELGRRLHDHIRWEERELFEAIQKSATSEQLAQLAAATAAMEKSRPGIRIRGRGPRP